MIPKRADPMSRTPPASGSLTIPRRADLDAVRAFAMLLGIALHAGLSFSTIPWIVQDSRQSEWFSLFFEAVHGFRMPLFFLVSGFFTAMLWRRRGLRSLLKQRAMRILLPLVLGALTIIPATNVVSFWAMTSALKRPQSPSDDGTLIAAVKKGDLAAIRQRLDDGADANATDAKFGATPLDWAAMRGDTEAVQLLIARGADVNARNKDGSTALHGAAFLGRARAAELLISKGADTEARNIRRETPLDATKVNWGITRYLASLLDLPIGEKSEIDQGRVEVARLLGEQAPPTGSPAATARQPLFENASGVLEAYQSAMTSNRLSLRVGDESFHLVQTPVFAHLWFLWYLCLIVPIFAAVAWASDRLNWGKLPRLLVLSPIRFLWLIPLTLLPQFFMGLSGPSFGPDASTGILPMPHLLLYYGIFFGFGALYFDSDDEEGRLGRWWWLLLPAGFLLALPIGIATMVIRPVTSIAQVVYTWTISFGVMGLFRRLLKSENKTVRYISDSSYWLYLTHLPLVLAAQVTVRDWPLPATAKFVLICTTVTGVLLVAYQTFVRFTRIGTMLNGPRTRPARAAQHAGTSPFGPETT
jgi:surface polysaccharide O-acyltransferase-like enzyme